MLAADAVETETDDGYGPVRRYAKPGDVNPPLVAGTATETETLAPLPAWLRASPARDRIDTILLRPSEMFEGEGQDTKQVESQTQRSLALKRGVLVHRLLQSLPDVALDRRHDTALRYLARNAEEWSQQERDDLAAQVIALIGAERFAAVFAPGSRAEVSIVGRLGTSAELGGPTPATDRAPDRSHRPAVLVSGQIDRLAVTPSEVLIVDYKTNHHPPRVLGDCPPAYIRQLALYRALLGRLHPQKQIRAALLWTENAEIMEIPAAALDAELARIISP